MKSNLSPWPVCSPQAGAYLAQCDEQFPEVCPHYQHEHKNAMVFGGSKLKKYNILIQVLVQFL